MRFLLDTCAFLWISEDSQKVNRSVRDLYLDQDNDVYLSTASAWEIGIKFSSGKLSLPERPDVYVPKMRLRSRVETLEIGEESALLAGKLPNIHADPFDRMLVAQAIVHDLIILTPDPKIEAYAVRVLW